MTVDDDHMNLTTEEIKNITHSLTHSLTMSNVEYRGRVEEDKAFASKRGESPRYEE
jgi:hypothetical protein